MSGGMPEQYGHLYGLPAAATRRTARRAQGAADAQ